MRELIARIFFPGLFRNGVEDSVSKISFGTLYDFLNFSRGKSKYNKAIIKVVKRK